MKALEEADIAERQMERERTTVLPYDALSPQHREGMGEHINLPLVAFCYLIRRLSVSTYRSFSQ